MYRKLSSKAKAQWRRMYGRKPFPISYKRWTLLVRARGSINDCYHDLKGQTVDIPLFED